MRTNVGFIGIRIAVTGSADLPNAVLEQEGFRLVPLHDYFVDGITMDEVDFGPIPFPELSAPEELALFDRVGAALHYMLPASADVNDTFVHALATIGLSHRDGFAWQSLPEAVLAGLRRAGPVVERIIDERWESMSDTVNGWRGSLASGRCSYDWSLNAANTKNQVGTELADQVVYLNCRVDAAGQPLTGDRNYACGSNAVRPRRGRHVEPRMYDDEMFFVANPMTGSRSAAPPTASPRTPTAPSPSTSSTTGRANSARHTGCPRHGERSTSPCGSTPHSAPSSTGTTHCRRCTCPASGSSYEASRSK